MALDKDGIAKRIAQELQDRFYVNLGIGIPTLVANYIPENINVMLQSENGLLGMGPFPTLQEVDPDLINRKWAYGKCKKLKSIHQLFMADKWASTYAAKESSPQASL